MLIGVVLLSSRTTEPSFQGKSLGGWLTEIMNAENDREAESAKNAVRQIGTNAVPFLVHLMQARDSRPKIFVMAILRRQHVFKIRVENATDQLLRATLGFEALGPQASSAVPALTAMLNDSNTVYLAGLALISVRPAGLDAVLAGLESTNTFTRRQCAGALAALGVSPFWSEGSRSREDTLQRRGHVAVPPLLKALNDSDELVRTKAAAALGLLGQQPELVVPALIRNLHQTNSWRVPASAAKALGRFGPDAASAIPELKKAAQHADLGVREAANSAIEAIESPPSGPRFE
jgi:hypothetical protein